LQKIYFKCITRRKSINIKVVAAAVIPGRKGRKRPGRVYQKPKDWLSSMQCLVRKD
jgi:hypothetical protein